MYIPREAFKIFAAYARIFKKHEVDMEIVQPTMFMLLPAVTGISFQNFQCHGSCCETLRPEEILASDFVCGHRINYQDTRSLNAVQSLLSQRSLDSQKGEIDTTLLWSSNQTNQTATEETDREKLTTPFRKQVSVLSESLDLAPLGAVALFFLVLLRCFSRCFKK